MTARITKLRNRRAIAPEAIGNKPAGSGPTARGRASDRDEPELNWASNKSAKRSVVVRVHLTPAEALALRQLVCCALMTESEVVGDLIESEWIAEYRGRA